MASIKKIQPGDVLYDAHLVGMGNTTMRTLAVFTVRIMRVAENGAWVSWNGNPERFYSERSLKKLRTTKPITIRTGMGKVRLATRAEIAAMKKAAKGAANGK